MGNILKKYNLTKAQWEVVGGAITGDTLPIGSIIPFGGTEAPIGWLICDGSGLNRETYKELFAAIGTNFGTDGPGNFYIPDLRGKVVVGQNASETEFSTLGKTGGEKTHTLTVAELATHKHFLFNGNYNYKSGVSPKANSVCLGAFDANSVSVTTNEAGGNQPHNNLQPYQVTNYIIKAFQSSGVVAQVSNTKSESTTDTYSCDYINKIGSTLNTIIENKYSTSWWTTEKEINSNFILIDLRSEAETDNVTLYLPVALLKKYSTYDRPYYVKNNSNLIFQCIIGADNKFQGLNRAEAGINYVANVYEVN